MKDEDEDEKFMADVKAAMYKRKMPIANLIIYIVILLIIVGLIWSYFAVIDQVTVATGRIIPSSYVKVIQSLDGGIVKEITIHEGQIVQAHQVLVVLDKTRYEADYQQAYVKNLALLARVARLTAQAENKNTVIFPKEVQKNAAELARRERQEFVTGKESFKKEREALRNSLKIVTDEFKMLQTAANKGIVARIDALRAERLVSETRSKLLSLEDEYYKRIWENLNSSKAELNVTTAGLASLQDKIDRTVIRSPIRGVVKKLNIVTTGGVINPGMNIMEIVPFEDKLLVEAYVEPSDIAFIKLGEPANVKVNTYDYTIYGSLKGKVVYVSADVIENKEENKSYYIVRVKTDKSYLGTEKRKLPILPGMSVSVDILTGYQTVMHYLFKPFIRAKEEALRER